MSALSEQDLGLTASAQEKMVELLGQIEDDMEGIRVFAQPGGCSGMSFGMTFADTLADGDMTRELGSMKLIVGADTIEHLKGAEIDFVDRGNGQATFVFNNVPEAAGGGCGTCGSAGGGCG